MLRGFTRFYHSFFMSVRQLSFFCFNIRERLLDKLGACKFLSITEFWSNKQELHKWWLIPEIRSHTTLRISRLHERVTTKTHPDWLAFIIRARCRHGCKILFSCFEKKFTKESWRRLMAFLSLVGHMWRHKMKQLFYFGLLVFFSSSEWRFVGKCNRVGK